MVHVRLKASELFAFTGVWDVRNGPTGTLFTVAIVTTTPNELTATVHERMPVIPAAGNEAGWLDPANQDTGKLQAMLKPYGAS
jgi:putative SOS response-associated peptidase YedK